LPTMDRRTMGHSSAGRGTNGEMITDSGGVSNMEDNEMTSVSPMRNIEELATPTIRTSPTKSCLFSTCKFIIF
jgi:hypothetical protein